MSEPTYWALCYSGADSLSCVRIYLPGTVLQWCWLFKQCQNLPAGHCVTISQAVYAMSEPTYRALCYSGAGCLSNARNYLPGTVLQWCRLLMQCQNLPTRPLCYSGAACLSNVRTYLPGTVLQFHKLFMQCQNLPTGHCVTVGAGLFFQCQKLPTGHCVTVVQTVNAMSEPTFRALCYSGAACFSNVRTYLPGTVLQWCRLFKQMSEPTYRALVLQWCRPV